MGFSASLHQPTANPRPIIIIFEEGTEVQEIVGVIVSGQKLGEAKHYLTVRRATNQRSTVHHWAIFRSLHEELCTFLSGVWHFNLMGCLHAQSTLVKSFFWVIDSPELRTVEDRARVTDCQPNSLLSRRIGGDEKHLT